jgi:hypothetical protein
MRTINTTDRFVKLDLSFRRGEHSQNISVAFERPVLMQWWYRVFRKPAGRYVALRDMKDAKGVWKFIGSVNLSELYPGTVIV